MLIRAPELRVTCAELSKAFRELKPDCGSTARISRYKSSLPGLNYLGIRSDCIFCIDKDKEELEYKSANIRGNGNCTVFVLPHIIRDILKVTDKDSTIVMYPHSQHNKQFVTIAADGCTWELTYDYEYPAGLIPPATDPVEVKPIEKPAPKRSVKRAVKQVAAKIAERAIEPELSGAELAIFAKSILIGG